MTPRDDSSAMSNTTSTTLLDHLKGLPLAQKCSITITLLCLLSSLVISLISVTGANRIIEQGTEIYGQSLANQLAQAASNPLIQGDHLSLQSLVNDSISSAALKRAAVYDVNNQPLVEAGEPYADDSYSASITFEQSIAGYVVVSYDASSLHRQLNTLCWQLVALALVLAAIVYGLSLSASTGLSQLLQNLSARIQADRTKSDLMTTPLPNYPGNDELGKLIDSVNTACPESDAGGAAKSDIAYPHTPPYQSTSTDCSKSELPSALITIKLDAQGKNQSDSNINHATLTHIQQQMLTLCKLYDGKFQLIASNTLCFQFYQQSSGDSCSFRALCAAYLLQHWIGEHFPDISCRFGLDLIPADKEFDSPFSADLGKYHVIDHLLTLGNTHDVAMVLTQTLCEQSEIAERTEIEWLAAGINKLVDINEPYRSLLLGQLKTLDRIGELN